MKWMILNLCLLFYTSAFANVAQPGMWNAGGTGDFSLLFQEDSSDYQKIQMIEEQVNIQLYPGFAVVKGQYQLLNHSTDTVDIRIGYPINSSFENFIHGSNGFDIRFDDLYALKSTINKVPVLIKESPIEEDYDTKNWYTWNAKFAPQSTTLCEVWFIVNTNNTFVRRGYGGEEVNGFVYLLETGATWKPPIGKGEIRIHFDPAINMKKMRGLRPNDIFRWNEDERILKYNFTNLKPKSSDNLFINYGKKIDNFDFSKATNNAQIYFDKIDQFSTQNLEKLTWETKSFGNPLDAKSGGGWIVGVVFMLGIFGPFILLGILIVFLMYWYFKKKHQKLNNG